MPARIRRTVASVKERIEQTLHIASKEMAWYRGRAGELRPAARQRSREGAVLLKPSQSDKSVVHTHTFPSTAFPTKTDL